MKYIPPLNALPGDEEDDNRSYWNADPSGANLPLRQGAYPDARGFESVQREILNVITGAGITPDENDLTQLFDAIEALGGFDVVSPTTETDISDGDFLAFADVSAANANKKITFLNLLGKIIPRILIKDYTNQETLNDADYVPFEDVSNSNANRKVTLAALKAFIVSGVTTPDATTTTKGKAEIATIVESQTGTDSTRYITPDTLHATMLGGVDQSWTDVSGSRSEGVTYTNTTGRPIVVMISLNSNGTYSNYSIEIDGTEMIDGQFYGPNSAYETTETIIVPNNSTYELTINVGSLGLWKELR